MEREALKTKKIISEIVGYLLYEGDCTFKMDVSLCSDFLSIEFVLDKATSQADLHHLMEKLSVPRMQEYENYYDELLGIGDEDSLAQVGYMVDESSLLEEDGVIRILILRKK